MKTTKSILTLVCAILLNISIFAQAPERLNYQGVARNASGAPIANQVIALRIGIRDNNANGAIQFQETHNVSTNAQGLYAVAIGGGNAVSGTMSAVTWGSGDKFIQVEIDPNGGTAYVNAGTNQLLSVPYALYAASGNPGPEGPQGQTGPQGAAGPQGSAGATGPQGTIGLTGSQGPIGATGPAGSANINGTTNYLTKFTNATTGGNSQIFDNGNFVGFNTTLPLGAARYRFHQTVSGNFYGGMLMSTSSATGRPFYGFGNGTTQLGWIEMDGGDGNKMKFHNGSARMTIANNGNVGIGTTNPTRRLEVAPNGTSNESTVYATSNATSFVDGIIRAEYTGSTTNTDHTAIWGSALYDGPTNHGIGVTGYGGWYGVAGRARNSSSNVTRGGSFICGSNGPGYGVYGSAFKVSGNNNGTKYGVYGVASGGTTNYGVFCSGNGGHTGTWTQVSDRKLKQNIRSFGSALDRIMLLNVYSYEFKTEDPAYAAMHLDGGTHHGFISQELEEVMPELVRNEILHANWTHETVRAYHRVIPGETPQFAYDTITICPGDTFEIQVLNDSLLNDNLFWALYQGDCNSNLLDTSATGTFAYTTFVGGTYCINASGGPGSSGPCSCVYVMLSDSSISLPTLSVSEITTNSFALSMQTNIPLSTEWEYSMDYGLTWIGTPLLSEPLIFDSLASNTCYSILARAISDSGLCESNPAASIEICTNCPLDIQYDTVFVCSNANFLFPDGHYESNIIGTMTRNCQLIGFSGCDSLVQVTVQNPEPQSYSILDTICFNSSYSIENVAFYEEVQTSFTVQYPNFHFSGCIIGTVDYIITVLPADSLVQIFDTICQDASYMLLDSTIVENISANMELSFPISDQTGCQIGTIEYIISVLPSDSLLQIFDTICQNTSYVLLDNTVIDNVTSNFETSHPLISQTGCQIGVVEYIITVVPDDSLLQIFDTICQNTSYVLLDSTIIDNITANFETSHPLMSQTGCQIGVVEYIITVEPADSLLQIFDTICQNTSYTLLDNTIIENVTSSVEIFQPIINQTGCQIGVVEYALHVIEQIQFYDSTYVCYGGQITFEDGFTISDVISSIEYQYIIQSSSSCDSVVNMTVLVYPDASVYFYDTICSGDQYIMFDFTFTESGVFEIPFVDQYDCESMYVLNLLVSPCEESSLISLSSSKLGIYPNPASSTVTIKVDDSDKIVKTSLYDATGKLVQEIEDSTFSVQMLSNGVYLLHIVTANQNQYIKLVVDK